MIPDVRGLRGTRDYRGIGDGFDFAFATTRAPCSVRSSGQSTSKYYGEQQHLYNATHSRDPVVTDDS